MINPTTDSFVMEKQYAHLTLGKMVRHLREAKGWTQTELAKHAKMTQATISSIENEMPIGVERIERLARAFKVNASLLAWPNDRPYDRTLAKSVAHAAAKKAASSGTRSRTR